MAQGSWIMPKEWRPDPWDLGARRAPLAVNLDDFFVGASQSGPLILVVCFITKGGWFFFCAHKPPRDVTRGGGVGVVTHVTRQGFENNHIFDWLSINRNMFDGESTI